jgi:hypothetical protein
MIDIDQFEERAAIIECSGEVSRFHAETLAAREQGKTRAEVLNEIRMGHPAGRGDRREAVAREQRQGTMPLVQSRPEEKDRSVPVGHAEA